MKINEIIRALDKLIPNPCCELNYKKDYELLIAVMLSAQCTDKRVNIVTGKLFSRYSLKDLAEIPIYELQDCIKSLGSYTKKAYYIKEISKSLLDNYNGSVPCDRKYLESLPGVGRKTASVVLSELFNIPNIAVDTHVFRVAWRLGFSEKSDSVLLVEKKLEKLFSKNIQNRINHQLLLFGRYYCTAKSPKCNNCPFSKICHEKNSLLK